MNPLDLQIILKARGRNALHRNCINATNDLMTFYKTYKTTLPVLAAYGFENETSKIEQNLAELLETFNNLRAKIWDDVIL